MPQQTIYVLAESNLSISDGAQLSGVTQGTGIHLVGKSITLNNTDYTEVVIDDPDGSFADNDRDQSIVNDQTFDGIFFAAGSVVEAEYQLIVEDPAGNVYTLVAFNINGPPLAPFSFVEGLAFIDDGVGTPPVGVPLLVTASGEFPTFPYETIASPPCFVRGCQITTPLGNLAVETLSVGDWVVTKDHGPQQIRWIGTANLAAPALRRHPEFRPIEIAKDAFGPGQPLRDTYLSPQHRVLISGWKAELLFGAPEILVPAAKLTNDRTVLRDQSNAGVQYFHIMFDNHEIIWCDGLPCESYFYGATDHAGKPTREELGKLFPQLDSPVHPQAARPCFSERAVAVLA